ncbi:MAG TPA: hypothetical protein VE078_11075, partial [Thermoanaerobaculia bacterium]|nr:hypothetical protein [Thermoanaerobaculia bacterium]
LLEQTYKREYGHSLRWMLKDEIEDTDELGYALELLDAPVGEGSTETADLPQNDPAMSKLVAEAYAKVAREGAGFGVWWERKEDGSARYDERYWEFKGEQAYKEGTLKPSEAALTLRPEVEPHVAVDAIFNEKYQWKWIAANSSRSRASTCRES